MNIRDMNTKIHNNGMTVAVDGWCFAGLFSVFPCWYLSDDQRAVFAWSGARIALAFIVHDHGFHRLRLSIA